MIDAKTPITALEAMLMELVVPCRCQIDVDELLRHEVFEDAHFGAHDADDEYCPESTEPCSDCQGSGVRYPLRVECICVGQDEEHAASCHHDAHLRGKTICISLDWMKIPDYSKWPTGPGYVFNPDHDKLMDAIRAKGWEINFYSRADWEGDRVSIMTQLPQHRQSNVESKEGLRGTHALKLAVCRALETE